MTAVVRRTYWRAWRAVSVLAASVAVAAASMTTGAAHNGSVGVTWNGTVGTLLRDHCVQCHSATGGAEPNLADYATAQREALAIKSVLLNRHMPQWYAVDGVAAFENDPRLTPQEVESVAEWADARGPEGQVRDTAEAAPPLTPPADLVLPVSTKHRIEPGAKTFVVPTGLTSDSWIRGWSFLPGNAALVASAVIRTADGSTLGTWVQGGEATFLPRGVTQRLDARENLQVTVYYRAPQGPAVDASAIALYLSGPTPRTLGHLTLPCGASRLSRGIDALAIRPLPGTTAWSLDVSATAPDDRLVPLARFQSYPADDAQTYWFRRAVALPTGSVAHLHATGGTCAAEIDYVTAAPSAPDAMQLVASHRIDRPTSAAQPADQPTQFWCPMHPDVRTEVDGVCTQCGMPLRPVGAVVPGAYDLDVHVGAPDTASGTQRLTLVARAPRTQEIATRFEKVHDRPFHLFILSEDLADYQHVHPVVGQDGALTVDARLPRGRAVELWADFLPTGGMPQLIRKTIVRHDARDQSGGATARHLTPDLASKSIAGMRVSIGEEARRLVAGRPTLLSVALEDEATGGPVADLQPYLGAWGHAFIVSSDLTDAVHSHPVNLVSSAPGPRIQFLQRFPRPGMYRVWMQFQRRGAVATAAFTVRVDEAAASVPLFADAR